MSPLTNPVTLSLKVMVIGMVVLVGFGAEEVIATVGCVLSKTNPVSVPVPPGVVTDTFPEVPPATTADICISESTLNELAGVPPKSTAVAPVNPVPAIVIVAPLFAVVGVKEVMVGCANIIRGENTTANNPKNFILINLKLN